MLENDSDVATSQILSLVRFWSLNIVTSWIFSNISRHNIMQYYLDAGFLDAKSVKSSRNLILIFLVAKVLGTSARKTSWTFSLPIKPSPHFSIAMCYVACHSCFSTFVGTTFIATSPKYVGVVTSYCVVAGSSQLRCQTFSSCCTQRDVR